MAGYKLTSFCFAIISTLICLANRPQNVLAREHPNFQLK